MAVHKGRYYQLPYLDNVNQPQISCGEVNKLKTPLRTAINACRQDDKNMEELISLLESSLTHVKQFETLRKKRTTKQRPIKTPVTA